MQFFSTFSHSPIPERSAFYQSKITFFVACYDKSLNRVFREEQMDIDCT